MHFYNESCDGCQNPLLQQEDIVTCPICGTPQHRSCWVAEGKCVNAARHADGFVWHPHAEEGPTPDADAAQPNGQSRPQGAPCPVCGQLNPEEALVCSQCGNSLIAGGPIPPGFANTAQSQNPFLFAVKEDPQEKIDGATVGDIAIYVQSRAYTYIPKFKKIAEKRKRLSWNWGAFFFGYNWFFYRKLYAIGALFMALMLGLSLFSAPAMNQLAEAMTAYSDLLLQQNVAQAQLDLAYSAIWAGYQAALPFVAISLLVSALCALIANQYYQRKVIREVKSIRTHAPQDAIYQNIALRRGGVSFGAALGSILLARVFSSLLFGIAEYFGS